MEQALETLRWAAENEIDIQVRVEAGKLVFSTQNGNIFAEAPISGSTPESIGYSLLTALFAIKAGTEFHNEHGFMPEPGKAMPGK